jgi:CysZ protein
MLTDTIVQRTFFISLGVAVLLLVAMFPATTVLVEAAGTTGYPWLDRLLEVLSLAGTAVLAWFLFPTVVAAVLGFLLDKVVAATERRHFPRLPAAEDQPVLKTLPYALGFAALVLVLNLLALPLYLVPGLNIPVYLALNGYLLGREYVELVLARRHSLAALKPLRRQYRRQIWGTGLVTAVLLLIPFLNLLAPVLGGALAALRVHRATARNLQR